MLHARFMRSPYANAVVKSVDATKAKAIPGAVEILTWETLKRRNCRAAELNCRKIFSTTKQLA